MKSTYLFAFLFGTVFFIIPSGHAQTVSTWVYCSAERQTCQFTGTRRVLYGEGTGAGRRYVIQRHSLSVACRNQVFTDPAPGVAKACWYEVVTEAPVPAPAPTTGWTQCASENQSCSFQGTRRVLYGESATSRYVIATYASSTLCSNATFGSDPAPGIVKRCYYENTTTTVEPAPAPAPVPAPAPTTGWTQCASENQSCSFQGTRRVLYGESTTSRYIIATYASSVQCSNATFGSDPAPGIVKRCYYENTTTTVEPAPAPAPAPAPTPTPTPTPEPTPAPAPTPDTGSGTSGSVSASLRVTRVRGPAPLAVLFDATQSRDADTTATGDAFKDLTYSFDAGDLSSATYAHSGQLKRRHSGGPLFSYVFETPRSTPYIAKVRVQNSRGIWSEAQVEVTVEDPNQVFSGTNTICVGNSLPVSGSGGCPVGAAVSTSVSSIGSLSGKRLLLRRGESFGSLSIVSNTNDAQIGAFGSGALPVLSGLSVGANPSGTPGDHPSRVSVRDLQVTGDYTGPTSADDYLLLRTVHTGNGSRSFDIGGTANGYWRSNPPTGWSAQHFPDGRRLFYFENSIAGSGAYGSLIEGALVANTFHAEAPAQHALRLWVTVKSYIGHNLMGRVGDGIRHSFKLHSGGTRSCRTLDINNLLYNDCSTQMSVIANNTFGVTTNSNNWTVAIRPENTESAQAIEDTITENNMFVRGAYTNTDLLIVGRRMTTRGNRLSSGSTTVSTSTDGTSTNNCSAYPLSPERCGPYSVNITIFPPNWPQ